MTIPTPQVAADPLQSFKEARNDLASAACAWRRTELSAQLLIAAVDRFEAARSSWLDVAPSVRP